MNSKKKGLVAGKYVVPFVLVTSLFFMWGFARAILDVLNKHFQTSMDITMTRSAMIQATTYVGYFLMALPAGMFITRFGYRRGVVLGLLLFAAGSLLFIPSESMMSFNFFLVALFIIGCGLVVLETAANPYVTELGDRSTAASRLNLAQSFNGLGCILAPVIMGQLLFSGEEGTGVALPYTVMGCVVLLVALLFCKVNLPEISGDDNMQGSGDAPKGTRAVIGELLRSRRFMLGVGALFCYEVAEISINSFFINYVTDDGWMTAKEAAVVLSFGGLGLFMLARVAGSWVMSRVAAEKVLFVCAVMTVAGSAAVVMNAGVVSHAGLFACYAFEAIMFPTVFAISIRGLAGSSTKIASSFLMMSPLGGAVGTLLMGLVADATTMATAFAVPCVGYAAVLAYAALVMRGKLR
ncbi:MAG: sugar MFS transporter [Muribaculaceae bacterium]|nr:sugar MFS transporter [Muribaculaceae bacterium]